MIDERQSANRAGAGAGVIAVLAASVFWSFGGVLGKSAHVGGVVLSFWRLWIATGVLGIFAAVTHRWPTWGELKDSAISGVLFGLNLCVFFITLQYTSIAVALIIGALTPVVAFPVAVRFMGEHLTRVKVACSVLAITGVMVAVLTAPSVDGAGTKPVGYVWAVASLLLWSLYLLQTKRVRARVETVRYLFGVCVIATLTVSAMVLVLRSDVGRVHGAGWLWIALLAIGPGLTGHGLVAWAQPRVDASVTSLLIQLEPVGASIVAWIVLDERISLAQGVAMVVVVSALGVLAYRESRVVVFDELVG
ncbi:MAG: DMT family transporter [Actinomycetia bacterium]|nr:DMT family transporter [Actinomycetes bacterium]